MKVVFSIEFVLFCIVPSCNVQMFFNRNGELETDGNVPVIQEYSLRHDNAGYTFDNGPYFVMERLG